MTTGGSRLDDVFARLLARRETQGRHRRLTLPPPAGVVDFSSNSYLSLSDHPEVKRRYLALLLQQQQQQQQQSSRGGGNSNDSGGGSSHGDDAAAAADDDRGLSLGSGGSRLLDGNSRLAEALEARIAAFHRAPAGLLFNSGFDANAGLFGCAPQAGDAVVYDEFIHASVHDGMRLGRARSRMLPFAHNRVYSTSHGQEDARGSQGKDERKDAQHRTIGSLQSTLERLCKSNSGSGSEEGADFRQGRRNIFIAVEAIYSMDGDVAPLRDIVACVEACLPAGNGHIVIDEAHSTGILGHLGRGLVCQLGLEDKVWARVHTFGKAMGCSGAIILSSHTTRAYLINYARTFIYTTAMAYPALAAIHTTYAFLAGGFADPHRHHLQRLVRRAHTRLAALCRRHGGVPASVLRVPALGFHDETLPPSPSPSSSSSSPIIPLFTAHARQLASHCRHHGFLLRPIVAPTVPLGTDRVRCCLHAGNTVDEVDALCRVIERWVCHKMGVEDGADAGNGEQDAKEAALDNDIRDKVRKDNVSRL